VSSRLMRPKTRVWPEMKTRRGFGASCDRHARVARRIAPRVPRCLRSCTGCRELACRGGCAICAAVDGGRLHQGLCTVSRADHLPGSCRPDRGHFFACLLWTVHPSSMGMGVAFFHAFVPAAKALSGGYEEGIAGMLTIIKASLLASALMLLESCAGYLTSYQTPCVEGHVCECVRYTTVNRSWLDCRDYGRVKSRAH
jgi:hypothetical protein